MKKQKKQQFAASSSTIDQGMGNANTTSDGSINNTSSLQGSDPNNTSVMSNMSTGQSENLYGDDGAEISRSLSNEPSNPSSSSSVVDLSSSQSDVRAGDIAASNSSSTGDVLPLRNAPTILSIASSTHSDYSNPESSAISGNGTVSANVDAGTTKREYALSSSQAENSSSSMEVESNDSKAASESNEQRLSRSAGGNNESKKAQTDFYESKIGSLNQEEEQVKNGTHKEYLEQLAIIESDRERMIREANLYRDLKIAEIKALHAFQIKAADDLFNGNKKDLEDRFLAEIAETKKQMQELRDGIYAGHISASSASSQAQNILGISQTRKRKYQNAASGEDEGAVQDGQDSEENDNDNRFGSTARSLASRRGKPNNINIPLGVTSNGDVPLSFSLDEDTIKDDLRAIHTDWLNAAQTFLKRKGKCFPFFPEYCFIDH